MSVRTAADEKIDKAKDHIQDAIEYLSEVVINRCNGTSDYSSDYLNKLQRQFIELLNVRENLD